MSNGEVKAKELSIKGPVFPFAGAELPAEKRKPLPDAVHQLLMHNTNSIVRSIGGQSNRRSGKGCASIVAPANACLESPKADSLSAVQSTICLEVLPLSASYRAGPHGKQNSGKNTLSPKAPAALELWEGAGNPPLWPPLRPEAQLHPW